jgi:phosphoribosylformylglycinamidine synthase
LARRRHLNVNGTPPCEDGPVLFSVQVEVLLREGIADPQGATIERALPTLGFPGVGAVRVGKSIRFTIEADDETAARAEIDDLCHRFLTNPVLESSEVSIVPVTAPTEAGH